MDCTTPRTSVHCYSIILRFTLQFYQRQKRLFVKCTQSDIDEFQPVCRYCIACWFLVPLAICAAQARCAHKQPFFQLFNKSCANFLQILPGHGCYNLLASFAQSRQAIVCTELNPLQQRDFLKGLGTSMHLHGYENSDVWCRVVLSLDWQGQANKDVWGRG